MFTNTQLEKATIILNEIHSQGGIIDKIQFDDLFTEENMCEEDFLIALRETRFTTACLEKDLELIRVISLDTPYGKDDFTSLTKNGTDAIRIGIKKYIKRKEIETNREIITRHVTFWASLVAILVSIFSLFK